MDISWTPELVDRLTAMWKEGASCVQIAIDISGRTTNSTRITRNAVIGKIHRLGLNTTFPRSDTSQRKAARQKASSPALLRSAQVNGERRQGPDCYAQKAVDAYRRSVREPSGSDTTKRSGQVGTAFGAGEGGATPADPAPAPQPIGVDLFQLDVCMCKYPLGALMDLPPFMFCGAPCSREVVYCEGHAAIAYNREYREGAKRVLR